MCNAFEKCLDREIGAAAPLHMTHKHNIWMENCCAECGRFVCLQRKACTALTYWSSVFHSIYTDLVTNAMTTCGTWMWQTKRWHEKHRKLSQICDTEADWGIYAMLLLVFFSSPDDWLVNTHMAIFMYVYAMFALVLCRSCVQNEAKIYLAHLKRMCTKGHTKPTNRLYSLHPCVNTFGIRETPWGMWGDH